MREMVVVVVVVVVVVTRHYKVFTSFVRFCYVCNISFFFYILLVFDFPYLKKYIL